MLNFVSMKYAFVLFIYIFCSAGVFAQSGTDVPKSENCRLYTWQADGKLGATKSVALDTGLVGYKITNPAYKRTIAFQHLGNLGSAGQSKIFSDRDERSQFIFFQPYTLYYIAPEDIIYYNTKRPYANISYYNGGPANRKQENLNGVFSVNINPYFNMGMYGKWQNNYGTYNSQSAKNYNAGFFGSYNHRHSDLMANISFNGYQQYENGGLTDTRYVTDPKNTGDLDSYNMPTFFESNVTSRIKNWNTNLSYKYNFGHDKSVAVNEDSSTTVFIPVSSIIYNFRTENSFKRFKETAPTLTDTFYNRYGFDPSHRFSHSQTNDSTHFFLMSHLIGLSLNEEFNTLAKFGFAAYLSFEQKKYGMYSGFDSYYDNPELVEQHNMVLDVLGQDSLGWLGRRHWNDVYREKIGIGANISKHKGEHLTFSFGGDYYFKDEKKTNDSYNLNADIKTAFSINNTDFYVRAKALRKKWCPDFFEEHYMSNRISWDKDFDSKTKTEFEGEIGMPNLKLYSDSSSNFWSHVAPEFGLALKVNENILNNYIYWNRNAVPDQTSDNISVLNITVKESLKFWYLHFDNELTFQSTNADESILDLPNLCLYSNLYFMTKPLFKVLTIQVGLDMRYNTAYYAPAYMPATGLYYSQTDKKIGDYGYYDLYVDFHLKSFRVFFQYAHFNNLWSTNYDYLVTPGYALDRKYIKFGVSVNFDN